MLITGTDTYITALDADAYLDTQYTRLNPLRAMWSVLSVNDKEVYLRQAANRIDSLMLKGEKEASEQTMQFPRTRRRKSWEHRMLLSMLRQRKLFHY